MKTTYTYTILRYMHDPSTGEFANVGVALYAPEARFASALCRTTYKRLSAMFPDLDGDAFRSLMRFVQSQFQKFNQEIQEESLFPARPKSVMELAYSVLPHDDSSFRWSEPAGGITDNPVGAMQKIFARMVSRYDERTSEGGRDDNDVRTNLGHELQQREVTRYLKSKTISAPKDEIVFPYAHKNGRWSCLDGISFDLAQPETIKNKARKWLGQASALSKSSEDFKLYLMVAEPRHPDASQRKAVHQAFDLLEEMPIKHQIIHESEFRQFTDDFAEKIKAYEKESAK